MSNKLPKDWTLCKCGCKVPPGKQCPLCNNDGSAKKVAIALDKWKLSVFSKELEKRGFAFAQRAGPTPDTLILMVVTEDVLGLRAVVEVCQGRCSALRN